MTAVPVLLEPLAGDGALPRRERCSVVIVVLTLPGAATVNAWLAVPRAAAPSIALTTAADFAMAS
eukprot:CAMPEP_0197651184 /NCGR_PEP_ID=MMETSP1338-20131121/31403_1 /TAXON_ID=43686 ORGANISM="Pelagodinium beii, Strain RCC1491" /NCGR_SAMPLE_ID=MMETSP1338 /ASSEMBLY_ACC=CAM_ASM_000754 /LENGTH=64 /DNA_ID=CAMNT_0043225751 /DNA_START=8 /DNA_END=202 /DNA_ORIENTATION=+